MKHKVLLLILDGFGLGDPNYKYNAVFAAKCPNLRRFLKEYPHSSLKTSGLSVGLPEGQMGNSEVGHMAIGSGRVIYQDLPRISHAINTGELFAKPAIAGLLQAGKRVHIIGLCSNGGVHSHASHIHALANFLGENGVKVKLHAISDGRDVPPRDFLANLQAFEGGFTSPNIELSTLCGRYFTMDRDNKQERTEKGLNVITKAEGLKFASLKEAVETRYAAGETDEFISPCVIGSYDGVKSGDIVIMANFRADRMRQITAAALGSGLFSQVITMAHYSDAFNGKVAVLFEKEEIKNTLAEVVCAAGLRQFRIAETEKYAHVTFFFNGGKEAPVQGEERVIIPSPKVATYDLQPQMSLPQVEAKLLEVLAEAKYDFIASNIANGDMVGHTGNFKAAIEAVERIDELLGKLEAACLKNGYVMLITADHGNLEEMLDANGQIHTQHTTGDVPFFVVCKEKLAVQDGSLKDIAPTVLALMGLQKPSQMQGSSLIA